MLLVGSPTANIAWDGYGGPEYSPPRLDPLDPGGSAASAAWVRATHDLHLEACPFGGNDQVSGLYRGTLSVQCFVPFGMTDGPDESAESLADQVATIYVGRTVAGVSFTDVTYVGYTIDPRGPWHLVVVSIGIIAQSQRGEAPMAELSGRMSFRQPGHPFAGPPPAAAAIVAGAWVLADRSTSTPARGVVVGVQGDVFQVATHAPQGLVHGLGPAGDLYLGDAGEIVVGDPGAPSQPLGQLLGDKLINVAIGPLQE
jgi:hypothetical protein